MSAMAEIKGLEMLRELCTALGIDPDARLIRGISLNCHVTSLPEVVVTELVNVDSAERLREVVKRYQLVPMQSSPVPFPPETWLRWNVKRDDGVIVDCHMIPPSDWEHAEDARYIRVFLRGVGTPNALIPVEDMESVPYPAPTGEHDAAGQAELSRRKKITLPKESLREPLREWPVWYAENVTPRPDADAPHVVE